MTVQITEKLESARNGASLVRLEPAVDVDAPAQVSLAELRAEAQRLIREIGRPVRRVSLRAGDALIEVDWEVPADRPAPLPSSQHPVAAVEEALMPGAPGGPDATPRVVVASPLVGTFYQAPSPGAPAFLQLGDLVESGQQLAIVEAMKLLNPITAPCAGRVHAVLVADGEMVEFGQPLLEIDNSGPRED